MLNKIKSFGFAKGAKEAKPEKTVTPEGTEMPEINVEAVLEEVIANQEVVQEVTFMENLALETMSVLKDVPHLFKKVMNAKPENAYEEVVSALEQLRYVSHANEKINRDKVKALKADYRTLQSSLDQVGGDLKSKIKLFFSVLLHEAGSFLLNAGLFTFETSGVITVFAIRMIGHLGKETRWACQEIGSSFKHHMIQPYLTK